MQEEIGIFSANYLPNIGGVEKYTQNLAYELARRGYKVTIVTNNVFSLSSIEQLAEDVEIIRLPCFPLFNGRLPLPKRNSEYRRLMCELDKKPISKVLVNTRFYPHSFEGVRFAERKGVRPVVLDHGSAYLTFGNSFIDWFVARYEHLVTFFMKRHSVDFYGVSNASNRWLQTFKISSNGVLNNSIDAAAFRAQASQRDYREELGLSPDSFVVSYTGRFIPEKGVRYLAQAANELLEYPDIHFLLAGDGPLFNEVESATSRQNMHLLGRCDAADISALLLQSDVFCLPTRSEGFSTSLLEAAACGVAPVIPNVGGVEEMIPSEEYGLVLPQVTTNEIVDAILRLYRDRDSARLIASNLKNRVDSQFSWEKTAERVIAACAKANGGR